MTANTKAEEKSRAGHSSTTTHHHTSPPTTNTTTHKRKRSEDNIKGQEQCEGEGTQSEHGASQHTPLPPFNRTTTQTKGGRHHTNGGHRHSTESQQHYRPSLTMPPHHPLCHPPFCDGPTHHHEEGEGGRGYPTTRTPQTHTHHPHTAHLARNSA